MGSSPMNTVVPQVFEISHKLWALHVPLEHKTWLFRFQIVEPSNLNYLSLWIFKGKEQVPSYPVQQEKRGYKIFCLWALIIFSELWRHIFGNGNSLEVESSGVWAGAPSFWKFGKGIWQEGILVNEETSPQQ